MGCEENEPTHPWPIYTPTDLLSHVWLCDVIVYGSFSLNTSINLPSSKAQSLLIFGLSAPDCLPSASTEEQAHV